MANEEGQDMSVEEQDTLLGRMLRLRRDKREALRLIERTIDEQAIKLGSLKGALENRTFQSHQPYYCPPKEEIDQLFQERAEIQQAIAAAEETLKGFLD